MINVTSGEINVNILLIMIYFEIIVINLN